MVKGKITLEEAPAGFEYKLVPKEKTREERISEEIARLESELADMKEPDEKELIEYGKMFHPYYDFREMIKTLKGE